MKYLMYNLKSARENINYILFINNLLYGAFVLLSFVINNI